MKFFSKSSFNPGTRTENRNQEDRKGTTSLRHAMTAMVVLMTLLLLCYLHSVMISVAADDRALPGGLEAGNLHNVGILQEQKCNITGVTKPDSTGYQKCVFCEAIKDAECHWCWDDDSYLKGSCCNETTIQ